MRKLTVLQFSYMRRKDAGAIAQLAFVLFIILLLIVYFLPKVAEFILEVIRTIFGN